MTKDKKDLLKTIMNYVSDSDKHSIDETSIELDLELDSILDDYEDLAIRIENGEFDLTIEELKDIKAEWIREE